jgi:hypothetical protein
MSSYHITDYSRQQAKKLGVKIKPSTNPLKKIDVFKHGEKVASIGSSGHNDFPTWKQKEGIEYANKRRSLYKARHEKNRHVKHSAGYYADKILW